MDTTDSKHLFIDCRQGITGKALRHAFVDLITGIDNIRIMRNTHTTLLHVAPQASATFYQNEEEETIAINGPDVAVDVRLSALTVNTFLNLQEGQLSDAANGRAEPRPEWMTKVLDRFCRLLQSISNDDAPKLPVMASTLMNVVYIVHALHLLHLSTVSASALPYPTVQWFDAQEGDVRKRVPDLFTGLSIDFNASNVDSAWDASGLAILNVLTHAFPPLSGSARTVAAMSVGYDKKIAVRLVIERMKRPASSSAMPTQSFAWSMQSMCELQANLDDMTPEHLAECVQLLLEHGAPDSWLTPIVMKKGRAAQALHCLCKEGEVDRFLNLIFMHSTTLGIRIVQVDRAALPRSIIQVQTCWTDNARQGIVDVKVAMLDGRVVSRKPEFDHCREIAVAAQVSVQVVAEQALKQADMELDKAKDVA